MISSASGSMVSASASIGVISTSTPRLPLESDNHTLLARVFTEVSLDQNDPILSHETNRKKMSHFYACVVNYAEGCIQLPTLKHRVKSSNTSKIKMGDYTTPEGLASAVFPGRLDGKKVDPKQRNAAAESYSTCLNLINKQLAIYGYSPTPNRG